MGCATTCWKYLLFAFNLIFVIIGAGMIAGGVITKLSSDDLEALMMSEHAGMVPAAAIVVGVITFVLAFLGCCGSIMEQPCMLLPFSVLTILVVVAELTIALYAFSHLSDMKASIAESVQQLFDRRNEGDLDSGAAVDGLQTTLRCCAPRSILLEHNLPSSCCPPDTEHCTRTSAFTEGCIDAVMDIINQVVAVMAGAMAALGVVQIVGIVLGFWLSLQFRKPRSYTQTYQHDRELQEVLGPGR